MVIEGEGKTIQRYKPIRSLTVNNCFVRTTLDTRHSNPDKDFMYQAVITFHIKNDKRTIYHPLPYKFTKAQYEEISNATGRGKKKDAEGSPYATKLEIIKIFDGHVAKLREFAEDGNLTYEQLQRYLSLGDTQSFIEFWQQFNNRKGISTWYMYNSALRSFKKHVAKNNGAEISKDDIKQWRAAMEREGLSLTTISIYERTCRIVWKEAIRNKVIPAGNFPFGKVLPIKDRRRWWLDVDHMTELYNVFTERRYPDSWSEEQKADAHESLGLFLFQYLGNGCNLADVGNLRWDKNYYDEDEKILVFTRQKTESRTGITVVIPIIQPLRHILNEVATKPSPGSLVFPQIYQNEKDPRVAYYRRVRKNNVIAQNLRRITASLGWKEKPSNTWARHSFATNLTHADVPERYISEAMGHSLKEMTSRYIDIYPISQRMKYNSLLLKGLSNEDDNEKKITLTEKEYMKLLMLANKAREL